MKNLISGLICLLILCSYSIAQPALTNESLNLYPILDNNLWGYMNHQGQVVILPQFHVAGQFSEGLAAVRVGGYYGYIDQTSNLAIPPKYDVGYAFVDGYAKVYVGEKPYIIDQRGHIIFEHPYKEINAFAQRDYAMVTTHSGKKGLIDREGKLIVDTIFHEMGSFTNKLAVVEGIKHNPYPGQDEEEATHEIGVINETGEFIVPYGKYSHISSYKDGMAKVQFIEYVEGESNYKTGFIDTLGDLQFIIPKKKWDVGYGNEGFSEGLAIVDIYLVDRDTIKVWSSDKRYDYPGVINTKGEIVFGNKNWNVITPFSNNRAFVKDFDENWYLIDRTGKQLNDKPYQNVNYWGFSNETELFIDGIAIIQTENGWTTIDTNGTYLQIPIDLHHLDLHRIGSKVLLTDDISVESDEYTYLYGFWDLNTHQMVEPQYHNIHLPPTDTERISVEYNGRMSYINQEGDYIWQEKTYPTQLRPLNIDYMNRGYLYAHSPYIEKLAGFGGWGSSENAFKLVDKSQAFKPEELSLEVRPNDTATYGKSYLGMKIYAVNTTKDTVFFDAQNSRIYLKLQAQDSQGQWKDIEYIPNSWCGNSYHILFLPTNHFWEFSIPAYEGGLKTKLRAELLYKQNEADTESKVLYSNEFEGSINPGQFWRKQPYYPAGIMDPYNE